MSYPIKVTLFITFKIHAYCTGSLGNSSTNIKEHNYEADVSPKKLFCDRCRQEFKKTKKTMTNKYNVAYAVFLLVEFSYITDKLNSIQKLLVGF